MVYAEALVPLFAIRARVCRADRARESSASKESSLLLTREGTSQKQPSAAAAADSLAAHRCPCSQTPPVGVAALTRYAVAGGEVLSHDSLLLWIACLVRLMPAAVRSHQVAWPKC
jgi:hypothetical protein